MMAWKGRRRAFAVRIAMHSGAMLHDGIMSSKGPESGSLMTLPWVPRFLMTWEDDMGRRRGRRRRRRRSKSILTTPKRASATATGLQDSVRAQNGRGSGGRTRTHRMPNKELIITITDLNQSRTGLFSVHIFPCLCRSEQDGAGRGGKRISSR
jgi:hypothetical protein